LASVTESNQSSAGANRLVTRVAGLLNGCLGAVPYPLDRLKSTLPDRPWLKGLGIGLGFAALIWLPLRLGADEAVLWLALYGAAYIAWATITARYVSASILEIISSRIVPELAPETVDRIDQDLSQRFKEPGLSLASWGSGLLGATIAAFTIHHDFPDISSIRVMWLSVGWLFLFVTAARATMVGRFYYWFARHLDQEPNIYPLDPARAVLVKAVAAIGPRVLLFWCGILLAIALLIPVYSLASGLPMVGAFGQPSFFLWFVVPVTSFFSIMYGTRIFLKSERAIRVAVDRVSRSTLRGLEKEVACSYAFNERLGEAEWKRVRELEALHKNLSDAGTYRSPITSSLSILVPVISPAAAVAKLVLG